MQYWGFLFAEDDVAIVEDIAKLHKVDKAVVEKHYKAMLEELSNEVQNKA